jgi:hypothetical protein
VQAPNPNARRGGTVGSHGRWPGSSGSAETPSCDETEQLPDWSDEICISSPRQSNVLLIGQDADTDRAIAWLTGNAAASLPAWWDETPMALPESPVRTVLVRNALALDAAGQVRLNRWLEAQTGAVRVISTAPESLFALVERCQFLESLYYRLNIICVECSSLHPSAGPTG